MPNQPKQPPAEMTAKLSAHVKEQNRKDEEARRAAEEKEQGKKSG